MPIEISIWERRDNGDREVMGNTSVELCRIVRGRDGIRSAKFYWSGSERVVSIIEGETEALNAPATAAPADYARLAFTLADNARNLMTLRLGEPRDALQTYRAAGR
ncbi:MAG TPA: hypothetical protein G4O18_05355 [Dehalococcoidia bacterium]|nr:hypothetical protein [Dehalococcoidia bacterium]